MAWRLWVGLGLLAASIGLAVAATLTAAGKPTMVVAAVLLLAGAGLLVSKARFWRRAFPRLPPMPDLMRRPRPGQRWCAVCGRPAPAKGPCPVCGLVAARERRRVRKAARVQAKQRADSQEKKA